MALEAAFARYNELCGEGRHTGAKAFSDAMNAKDPVDMLAYGFLAISVNNALQRQGKLNAEDVSTVNKAMTNKLVEQFAGPDESVRDELMTVFEHVQATT